MTSGDANPIINTEAAALEREAAMLRQRVTDLQRQLAQVSPLYRLHGNGNTSASIPEREALLVEAERIAHMGSWVWNLDTNQVVWSNELYRILGYDPDHDVASADAFFAALHPDDRERIRAISIQAASTGVAPRAEHRVLHADGTVRHVLTDGASIFDENGKLRRLVGTVLDVTEAREAERQLAQSNALLEEAQALGHMGSWVLNLATGKIHWSNEFCRILGVAPGTNGSEAVFMQRVHPDDLTVIDSIRATMQRNFEGIQFDARIVHDDGTIRYVRIVGLPYSDAAGKTYEIRGTILDLTDLRRLQKRLAEAEKMEAIGRLAGGIAHDFNNLLMVVRGNLELLDAQNRPELAAIFSAIESAQTLTAGLLAFGRKSQLQRRVFDLNELVNSTVSLLGRLVGEHIVLRTSLDAELPLIDADHSHFQQALINLMINARDALAQGGTITVCTQAAIYDNTRYVELSVTDDGPGIDATTQAHLFEPFFTTKADSKGSGLGLAMVHGTVTQHGGTVHVESQPGQGCRFTLRLPAATQRHLYSKDVLPTSTQRQDPQHSILVVEDQPEVATLLRNLLQRKGYQVFSAERPSRALELFKEHPIIDMVLCDLNMPEMHGTVLAATLKQARPELPIVFMSGYSGDNVKLPENAKLLGKPFSFAELDAAIAEALAAR